MGKATRGLRKIYAFEHAVLSLRGLLIRKSYRPAKLQAVNAIVSVVSQRTSNGADGGVPTFNPEGRAATCTGRPVQNGLIIADSRRARRARCPGAGLGDCP